MSLELLLIFVKGLAVGFVGAVPLGPLGMICIRRTLQGGFIAGVIGGLGTAIADAIFGIISAFGLTVIAKLLHDIEFPLRVGGGVFMLVIGCYVLTNKPKDITPQEQLSPSSLSHMGGIVSNFLITLTNPVAIVFFTLAFASLGIAENQGIVRGIVVVTGVFCGSMISWIALSAVVSLHRNSKILSDMIWVNRVTGVVLLLCGIWSLGVLFPR